FQPLYRAGTKEAALCQLRAAHAKILMTHAPHLRVDGNIAKTQGDAKTDVRGGAVDEAQARQRLGILRSQPPKRRGAHVTQVSAGIDFEGIGSHRVDLGKDLSLRAI